MRLVHLPLIYRIHHFFSATTKTLQVTEAAHKQTSVELQRTRTALQAVRATHQAELKKKDREVERIMEKWNKISDSQAKLGATASGLRFSGCSNAAVGEPGGQVLGKGKNFLEVALEEAEKAREQLGKDNLGLRKMVLKAVNEVQSVVSEMRQTLCQPDVKTVSSIILEWLASLGLTLIGFDDDLARTLSSNASGFHHYYAILCPCMSTRRSQNFIIPNGFNLLFSRSSAPSPFL